MREKIRIMTGYKGYFIASIVAIIILPEQAPGNREERFCWCTNSGTKITCSGVSRASQISLCSLSNTTSSEPPSLLEIRDSGLTHLDLTWSLLGRLSPMTSESLKELKISNTKLTSLTLCSTNMLPSGSTVNCDKLPNLEFVDLRENELTHMAEFRLPSLKKIYLSDNKWECFRDMSRQKSDSDMWIPHMVNWFLDYYGSTVQNSDATLCSKPQKPRWYDDNINVTLVHFLSQYKEMHKRCPDQCECSIWSIVNSTLRVKVNCVEARLTDLPSTLPPYTNVLDVSNNKISSLEPLKSNSDYKHLSEFLAFNNEISSMGSLIGSDFVKNGPTVLDLRHNKITNFNLDLMKQLMYQVKGPQQKELTSFLFGNNPWECECERMKQIQSFIHESSMFLDDEDTWACGENEEPILLKFNYENHCEETSGFDMGLNFTVVILAVLTTVILANLLYDYRRYRTTGKIPWLAKHLPLTSSSIRKIRAMQRQNALARTNNCFFDYVDSEKDRARSPGSLVSRIFYKISGTPSPSSTMSSGSNRSGLSSLNEGKGLLPGTTDGPVTGQPEWKFFDRIRPNVDDIQRFECGRVNLDDSLIETFTVTRIVPEKDSEVSRKVQVHRENEASLL